MKLFNLCCYNFPIFQKSVIHDNLYSRVEYLIFRVFLPVLPLSDLDPSFYLFSVLIILLLMYILILLVSNKQVSKHKFENRYFLNKKNFLKFSEKHFWDVFQVIWLLYRSINLVKSCLTKDSLLDISKLLKKRFF